MDGPVRRRWIWASSLAIALTVAGVVCASLGSSPATFGSSSATGDPGAKVMEQLTPTVTAIPGYGTTSLPWVNEVPRSLVASYAIKMEPHQDSCDGMAGTQGWSQVVVQSRFQWNQGLPALVAYMEPRLARLGWAIQPEQQAANPPSQNWTKVLGNGTTADLSVGQEGGSASTVWQLDALGAPVGKAVSGC
jgi:hypothetical protein